jgi:hypothetical protein
MSQKSNVIVVKVHRNAAGTAIPFDKLYFFQRHDRPLIPKVFGYALVLPIDEALMSAIYGLKPKKLSHLRFRRDDDSMRVPTGIDGRKHKKAEIRAWWDENIVGKHNLEDRVAVIPILTSKVRKRLHPRYLNSQTWYRRQGEEAKKTGISNRRGKKEIDVSKLDGAISELAYLATPLPPPEDKIRPLCSICPRMLRHLQGECIPGQLICYKSLDFNKIATPPEPVEAQDASV